MAQKLKFTIINIERDPRVFRGDARPRTVVSLKIDDGSGQEPYVRGFSLIDPPAPLTDEQFMELLESQDLSRPPDPWEAVRKMMDSKTEHEIDLGPEL